eukprot:763581-Hanusia_phi.AAC.4
MLETLISRSGRWTLFQRFSYRRLCQAFSANRTTVGARPANVSPVCWSSRRITALPSPSRICTLLSPLTAEEPVLRYPHPAYRNALGSWRGPLSRPGRVLDQEICPQHTSNEEDGGRKLMAG